MDWKFVIIGAIVIIAALLCVLTAKTQKGNIIEWLLWAVTEAERTLGSGTGTLKLREVYDWFVRQYPIISKIVPFSVFSYWVDIALDEMKRLLKKNQSAAAYVGGDVNG